MPVKWKQEELVVFNDGSYGAYWFASVLNTENGRSWTDRFKEKNPRFKVKKRFRHSNRRLAYNLAGKDYNRAYAEHVVPAATAERFVLYLTQRS